MTIRSKLVVAVAVLSCLAWQRVGQAGSCYVVPNGNDTYPGTLERPFATLQRAQQEARKSAGHEPVRVFLRQGAHYLPETLVFNAADSGTKDAPVVYQAYNAEKPVVSGGVLLANLRWPPYKDGIMQAKLPAGFATDQLFVNFPMDQFGVQKPELKAIARTPEIPQLPGAPRRPAAAAKKPAVAPQNSFLQAEVRDIVGLGERSVYGLPDESGALLLSVPAGSPAAKAGLKKHDVIVACNGQPVRTVKDLPELRDKAAGRS